MRRLNPWHIVAGWLCVALKQAYISSGDSGDVATITTLLFQSSSITRLRTAPSAASAGARLFGVLLEN